MSENEPLETPRNLIGGFLRTAATAPTTKPKRKPSATKRRRSRSVVPSSLRKRRRVVEETPRTAIAGFLATEKTVAKATVKKRQPARKSPSKAAVTPILKGVQDGTRETTERRRSRRLTVTFRDEQSGLPLMDFSSPPSVTGSGSATWRRARTPIRKKEVEEEEEETETEKEEEQEIAVVIDEPEPEPEPAEIDVGDNDDDGDEEEREDDPVVENAMNNNEVLAKKPQRKRGVRVPRPTCKWLKRGFVKKRLQHYANCRLSLTTLDGVVSSLNEFYDQLLDDLDAYANHAGRKRIDQSDAKLHLKRIGAVHDNKSAEALVYDTLPSESWKVLFPLARK